MQKELVVSAYLFCHSLSSTLTTKMLYPMLFVLMLLLLFGGSGVGTVQDHIFVLLQALF